VKEKSGLFVQIRPDITYPINLLEDVKRIGPWTLVHLQPGVEYTYYAHIEMRAWDKALLLLQKAFDDLGARALVSEGASWQVMPQERFRQRSIEGPKRVGNNWYVLPKQYSRLPIDQIKRYGNFIYLESGWAFGEGFHPTTIGCVHLLEMLASRQLIEGRKVLDIGTGTGILGIIAGKMGADTVLCLDVDPEAIRVSKKNVASNGLSHKVVVSSQDLRSVKGFWDIVLSNLTPSVLTGLSNDIVRVTSYKGYLVVSGFQKGLKKSFEALFKKKGFWPDTTITKDGWVAQLLVRQR